MKKGMELVRRSDTRRRRAWNEFMAAEGARALWWERQVDQAYSMMLARFRERERAHRRAAEVEPEIPEAPGEPEAERRA